MVCYSSVEYHVVYYGSSEDLVAARELEISYHNMELVVKNAVSELWYLTTRWFIAAQQQRVCNKGGFKDKA